MLSPRPPVEPGTPKAAWYSDPWRQATWRWWDGHGWTNHVAATEPKRKPRLAAWLSVPVSVSFPLIALSVVVLVVREPIAIVLGLVPLFIVGPTMWWLDRIEPEPRSSKVHAVLWGACVAGLISVIVNSVVAALGGEALAAVMSAPFIEELTKGAGILFAVRRREVDGVMDGIVYAGWIALGFAVVEDFTYFAVATDDGALTETFILRALITPFLHPLFTAWTGLAIGLAVAKGRSPGRSMWWGMLLAMFTHASWNGSLTLAEERGSVGFLALVALGFFALFVASIVTVVVIRSREKRSFTVAVPWLADRYGLSENDVAVFGDWKALLRTRRTTARRDRARFDEVHRSLAQLASLHARPGPTDANDEQRIYRRLLDARTPT